MIKKQTLTHWNHKYYVFINWSLDSSDYLWELSLGQCVQAVMGANSAMVAGDVTFGLPQAVAFLQMYWDVLCASGELEGRLLCLGEGGSRI